MRHYSSADEMKNATVDDLTNIPEMSREAAENLYAYFHG
jgi:excinuclease UvrABC nuclease subunit